MVRETTTKQCETFGCNQPVDRQRQIAPGTNVWICAVCWDKVKQENDQHYFENHPV